MDRQASVTVGLVTALSLLLAVACGPATGGGGEPPIGLEEYRLQTREQESRLLPAIETAAAKAGGGVRPLAPPRPLSERELRERWLMLSEPDEDGSSPAEQGLTRADLRYPAEGVYTSEYSAEEAYARYKAAYSRREIRFDGGCEPQAALDPEGAIVCSFMLQPEGGTDGLSIGIGPEYVTSEGKPARDYPDGPGELPTRLETLVRIEGGAPTRERLSEFAADDAFLAEVEVKPLRAGMGSLEWAPGLSASAVWVELEVAVRDAATEEKPLEMEAHIATAGCERNLSPDSSAETGGEVGPYVAGEPGIARLVNDDTPVDACPITPGPRNFKVALSRGESMRFLDLRVEIAPAATP